MAQSRLTSLLETLNRSLISGTSAAIIHYITITEICKSGSPTCTDPKLLGLFSISMFFIMFGNSIVWGYILRRIYERYGVQLDARNIARLISRKIWGSSR